MMMAATTKNSEQVRGRRRKRARDRERKHTECDHNLKVAFKGLEIVIKGFTIHRSLPSLPLPPLALTQNPFIISAHPIDNKREKKKKRDDRKETFR